MTTLWLDRETYSELDLKEVGTYRYADSAEDLLIAYAIDDGPVRVWDCTCERAPRDLIQALESADEVWAHNAQFDKAVHQGAHQAHLPAVALDRWRCSMAMALSHALPASLSDLCIVLSVPEDQSKLAEGKKLVQLFTRPQPANRKVRRADRHTHPAEWERFKAYAANDIVAMRECVRRMPRWNWGPSAIAEWHCDQRINERGFAVDRALTKAGARAAVVEKERIGVRFRELTGGVVERPSQRSQFQAFLNSTFGLQLDNTRSDTFLQELKNPHLDKRAAELMNLAISANKTSTSKYAALEPAIQDDDRFRGGLQFAGAGRTRRWAGRLFQPQNLPSRGLPDPEVVEHYIEVLKLGCHDLYYDNLMLLGAAALRGVVVAPHGKKLEVADLSNIEGRMLAWVSGEKWKLQAFREYDAGTGPDLYNITATSIIGGDPWKVEKKNRNVFGKVPDLACLAGDTQVLTHRGLVAIMEVLATDKVWDGESWVSQQGVIDKGVQPVVDVDGIEVTPDHLINTQGTWLPARQLVTCANTLSRALATGSESWKSLVLSEVTGAACETCLSGAVAEPNDPSWRQTCEQAKQLGAPTAPGQKVWTPGNGTGGMPMCAPMKAIDAGCLTESRRASTDAVTQTTQPTQTTGAEASPCTHHGRQTEKSFCGTCSHCQGGTRPNSNLIESEWTEVTNPATCDSSRSKPTSAIAGRCENSSRVSQNSKPVYDLLNAGPNNRFLVKSRSGWLLVHNCGYMGGVSGFQTFARAYNVRMADQWGVIQRMIAKEHVEKAKQNLEKWGRAQLEQLEISELEWVASETCKLAWRARHPATVRFWYGLQEAAKNAILNWGVVTSVGDYIKVKCVTHEGQRWMLVKLPSGRYLTYFDPRVIDGSISYMGEAAEEGKTTRQWVRVFTHGGKMTGNVCQTLARDILAPALLTAENTGYTPILTVHDEVITEVDDTDQFNAKGLIDILATNPPWATGLPLSAAGFEARRYKKD